MTENRPLARIEAFSDGVFAIAITLLILEIKVPPIDSIHSVDDLMNALLRQWPSFFAFLLTFGNILVQWVIHHNTFEFLEKTSRPFLYANGLLLLAIVFFPYPTALLAEYVDTEYAMPAIVLYGLASLFNGLGWFFFVRSLYKPRRLIRNNALAGEQADKLKKNNRFALVIYSSTTLLAIWLPYTALILNSAVWVIWIGMSLAEKERAT